MKPYFVTVRKTVVFEQAILVYAHTQAAAKKLAREDASEINAATKAGEWRVVNVAAIK